MLETGLGDGYTLSARGVMPSAPHSSRKVHNFDFDNISHVRMPIHRGSSLLNLKRLFRTKRETELAIINIHMILHVVGM